MVNLQLIDIQVVEHLKFDVEMILDLEIAPDKLIIICIFYLSSNQTRKIVNSDQIDHCRRCL